jgi:phosphoserine aminotransferase
LVSNCCQATFRIGLSNGSAKGFFERSNTALAEVAVTGAAADWAWSNEVFRQAQAMPKRNASHFIAELHYKKEFDSN